MENTIWSYTIDEEAETGRLDAVLAQLHDDLSRNRLKDLILGGAVSVNGTEVTEPKFKVKPGDVLELDAPPPEDPTPLPENIPLDILFEDDSLIIINKPRGLVVHPAPGAPTGTLVNALIYHCGDSLSGIGGVKRPGIVHRLDKDTTGVMVVAKTERAHNHLAAQFADHGRTGPLERAYIAYAWGRTQSHTGTVNAPLGRAPHNRLKQAVRRLGREAITHYDVQARFGGEGWDVTRIRCHLETGRTHQIRVHMAHIGHPLIADPLYATGFVTKGARLPEHLKAIVDGLGRQALHAAVLGFQHPETREEIHFEAPLPPDLQAFNDALEVYNLATKGSHR